MLEMVDRVVLYILVSIILFACTTTQLTSCSCSSPENWVLERENQLAEFKQEQQEQRKLAKQEQEEWEEEFLNKLYAQPKQTHPYELLDDRHKTLVNNILILSPRAGKNRSITIAKFIIEHSDFTEIPHENFVAAIIQRESHFSQRVENGNRRGALGEIGLMQVMPDGYAIHEFGNECEQTNARCNIMTGTRYLQAAREKCFEERETDNPWIWMSAYATGKCPRLQSARKHKSAKNARHIFCKITPECEDFWPL
jgi:hypothetical protein